MGTVERRCLVAGALALVLAGSLAGDTWGDSDHRTEEHTAAADGATGSTEPAATTTTTTRAQHPLSVLMADYDRLYAQATGDRAIFDNPNHPVQRRLRALLTPDSPLRRLFIISAFDESDPRHHVLRPGTVLRHAGERNAELPIIHELLGPLPDLDSARGTLQIPICNHTHYTIYDQQMQGIEASVDARRPGLASFRHVGGEWRLHEYGWRWDRPCERCGPEPPGTGHLATVMVDGEERPRRPDPPCPGRGTQRPQERPRASAGT
jgi:hypothetical protein